MNTPENGLQLSDRFTRAVEYARQFHTECRKGTCIPYMAHLFGVAALVMGEAGGPVPVTEDMVIAALLHDVVEDHGGKARLDEINAQFGSEIAGMVAGLSDSSEEEGKPKKDWKIRKEEYLKRLIGEPANVLLISVADKLYNAKAILDDFMDKAIGSAVFNRFKVGADLQVWYFESLLVVFKSHDLGRIGSKFETVVHDLRKAIAPPAV
jgi:(p)ppGpp synthase/HD superfamily hydrolase